MVEDTKDFYVCRQTALIAALSLPFQSQGKRIQGSSVVRKDFGLCYMLFFFPCTTRRRLDILVELELGTPSLALN